MGTMALRVLRTVAGLALGLFLLGPTPTSAAWPSAIMIYGDSLQRPVFINPSLSGADYRFLFGASTDRLITDLTKRPYLSLAMFWGADVWNQLKDDPAALNRLQPADARQHGRLYIPVGDQPAVVVATPYVAGSACAYDVDGQRVSGLGRPRLIPPDVKGFPCGWTLTDTNIRTLQALKIPGF